jgi:hypothetical protein
MNQHVNGGVTVVSHDTFVNARPVARNVVSVPPRELEAAPVSHMVAVEPVRSSVVGAGRPAANRPPAAVMNRQVVAQRTPAPMPRSFEQRQAQAGGHLNQPPLVRQEPPGRPVPVTRQPQTQPQPQTQEGFRPFGQTNAANKNNQPKPQPRVWEQQGTPEPKRAAQPQPENRNLQPATAYRPPQPQQSERQPAQEWSHPLAKPAPPVQERNEQQQKEQEQKFNNWQQQRPASPPPQKQQPAPKQEKPAKKGH